MPSRGRRVAARQAQLSRRKRRDHGPASIPADQPRSASATLDTLAPSPIAPTVGAVRAESRTPQAPPRRTEQRHMVYHYVGPEMRRIIILTGVIVAVLVIASFLIK
ncbi:MAG: hypothetical protein FJ320_02675 [SAR202 cluster bacterium]|nr:hypothetical protein [SAR202 cluster bacterium]